MGFLYFVLGIICALLLEGLALRWRISYFLRLEKEHRDPARKAHEINQKDQLAKIVSLEDPLDKIKLD